MITATVTLFLTEPKKHSVRYDASKTDIDSALTSVYVMKSALSQPWPKAIVVTIEPKDI